MFKCKKLKKFRKENGLKKDEINILGISKEKYKKIENGSTEPNAYEIDIIVKWFADKGYKLNKNFLLGRVKSPNVDFIEQCDIEKQNRQHKTYGYIINKVYKKIRKAYKKGENKIMVNDYISNVKDVNPAEIELKNLLEKVLQDDRIEWNINVKIGDRNLPELPEYISDIRKVCIEGYKK